MDYLKDVVVKENHIIYINLESYENQFIKNEQELSDLIYSKLPKDKGKVYLLVDEIQFIDGWQRVINSFRVSFDCDIVITGSNAKLLSGELSTLLSGRYVEIVVYPFSFKELLNAKNIDFKDRTYY